MRVIGGAADRESADAGMGPKWLVAAERDQPLLLVVDRMLDPQRSHGDLQSKVSRGSANLERSPTVDPAPSGRHPRFLGALNSRTRVPPTVVARRLAPVISSWAQSRTREHIEDICREHLDAMTLRRRILAARREAINFDVHVWLLTDPVTCVGAARSPTSPTFPSFPS